MTTTDTLALLIESRDWNAIAEMMSRRAWDMLIESDHDTPAARRAFDAVFQITSANDDWACWLADGDWSSVPTLDALIAEFVEGISEAVLEYIDGMDDLLAALGG